MSTIRENIAAILKRNDRVELEKAWETSWTRRICIAIITYGVAIAFLWMIDIEQFALTALVPTGGYILSTLSLPYIKGIWTEWYIHNRS